MREIKFRAWNGKEMIEPYSVKNGKAMIIKQCDKNDPVLTDGEGVNYYCNWDIDVETDYPLMQYTGLKDCEGTEIYEGDVIEDDEHYYSVISWDGDDSMFVASDVGALCDYNGTKIKVIGNIHQNPELVK